MATRTPKQRAQAISDDITKLQNALGPAPIVMIFNVGKEGPFVVEMVPTHKAKNQREKKTNER
ncbi:MAG: hypothetical protein RJA34_2516 [Pseudomonadota bacterium]|jgi:hypothetical protein